MIYRGFFSLWIFCLAALAAASNEVDKKAIAAEVKEHVKQLYVAQYTAEELQQRVEILPSNLDNRLRLKACDQPLSKSISSPQALAHNITVKVSCQGTHRWTIYVPVKVNVYADVAVAQRNLAKGSIIAADDLVLAKMNVAEAGNGYFESIDLVVGMEAKRNIRLGDALQQNALRSPTVIQRGETVILEATVAGVAVETKAKALTNGQLGEQIRVQNSHSKRVVYAKVTGPGKVSVSL